MIWSSIAKEKNKMHRVLSDIIFTWKPCSPFVSCFTFVVVLYMVYELSGINKSYGTPCLNDDNDNLITDQTVEVQTNEWL